LQATAAASRPIAGICAATLALAHTGLLDDRLHTSNGKDFIGRYVPGYRGQDLYRAARTLTDKNIITANGLAPFTFAAEIFRTLSPQRGKDISTYHTLYERGLLDPDPAW
jgi:putative intracellular protease/amidase